MVSYRGKVSVLELIVYAPCLPIALWLTIRHGLRRSAGWIYIIFFSQVRAGGAIAQLLSESNPKNISLYTAEAILQSFGLNPLLFIALCHLSRINRSISIAQSRRRPVSRWTTHAVGSVVISASALSVVGGINGTKSLSSSSATSNTSRSFHATGATKAGICLYILAYVLLIVLTLLTAVHFRTAEPGERKLGKAIIFTFPFIGIRLLYSMLVAFSTSPKFNVLTGSVTIWLLMAVLQEMFVVGIFLAAGWLMKDDEKRRRGKVFETGEIGMDQPMLPVPQTAPGGYQMVNNGA